MKADSFILTSANSQKIAGKRFIHFTMYKDGLTQEQCDKIIVELQKRFDSEVA